MKLAFYRNKLLLLAFSIVLGVALVKWRMDFSNEKLLSLNAEYTIGVIEDYIAVGEASYHLRYSYEVRGIKHFNAIVPKKLFKNCEYDKWCIGKRFYVKYVNNKPDVSEILLDSVYNNQ